MDDFANNPMRPHFLAMVAKQCIENGIAFILSPGFEVEGCSGYFDEKKKMLIVACGRPEEEWFSTLAHEFCHLRQWVDNDPTFLAIEESDAYFNLDKWLEGVDYSDVGKWINVYLQVELNCERRVLELFDFWSLGIEKDLYSQKANAYLLFYHEMLSRRQWYDPKTAPYLVGEICDEMPTDLTTLDYTKPYKPGTFWDKCFKEKEDNVKEVL